MLRDHSPEDEKDWKRINMRSVSHLLGVEFIHDLYNRYDPRINAIRFRHTRTTWKDGIVHSYAPREEWDELGAIVGYQYYSLDAAIIRATRTLYRRRRQDYFRLMHALDKLDVTQLKNEDLATVLLNFQSLVLGDLYVLNFVQVEHGLNTAVKRILNEKALSDTEKKELFVQLISTEKPTESQKEKDRLRLIACKWRLLRMLGFFNEGGARADVQKHCKLNAHLYSAYGEHPRSFEDFWKEFEAYLTTHEWPRFTLRSRLLSPESERALTTLKDPKLNVLVPLLVCGGIFRDTNKALLGKSLRHRFAILDEIARRFLETRENLDYYLLSEIVQLVRAGVTVPPDVLTNRKTKGVVLTRREDFTLLEEHAELPAHETSATLTGQGASKGVCEGVCKVVLSKEDADKVQKGDIMIAIGTDFDLIEAMYRSAAVITEEGGILSHASVVCRELGKPCCIDVKNATRLLRDGQRIRVDAAAGVITLLASKNV